MVGRAKGGARCTLPGNPTCVDGMVCKDVCVAGESYLYRIAEIECTNDW